MMIIRLFLDIPFHSGFLGYLGYQKIGINTAPFDKWSSFGR
jgi:hypothetical protein